MIDELAAIDTIVEPMRGRPLLLPPEKPFKVTAVGVRLQVRFELHHGQVVQEAVELVKDGVLRFEFNLLLERRGHAVCVCKITS